MRGFTIFVKDHVFIIASGLAALIHSVWSLDIAFAGHETSLAADPVNAIFRKAVAFLIAASIDIGQVVTASEIKKGHKSRSKYLTFFSFAIATYLLQFYYMIHHTPDLQLSEGIRAEWVWIVKLISDASVWIIPALLPMCTLFYTFSQQTDGREHELHVRAVQLNQAAEAMDMEVERRVQERLAKPPDPILPETSPYKVLAAPAKDMVWMTCPDCEWSNTYANKQLAESGLRGHRPYCKKTKVRQDS